MGLEMKEKIYKGSNITLQTSTKLQYEGIWILQLFSYIHMIRGIPVPFKFCAKSNLRQVEITRSLIF